MVRMSKKIMLRAKVFHGIFVAMHTCTAGSLAAFNETDELVAIGYHNAHIMVGKL